MESSTTRGHVPLLGIALVIAVVLFVLAFAVPWWGAGARAGAAGSPTTATWYDRDELTTRAVTDGAVFTPTEGAYLGDGAAIATLGVAVVALSLVAWIAFRVQPQSRTRGGAYVNAILAAATAFAGFLAAAGSARFLGHMVVTLVDASRIKTLNAGGLLWTASVPAIATFLFGVAIIALAAWIFLVETERGVGVAKEVGA